jgi:hypothetical protein
MRAALWWSEQRAWNAKSFVFPHGFPFLHDEPANGKPPLTIRREAV